MSFLVRLREHLGLRGRWASLSSRTCGSAVWRALGKRWWLQTIKLGIVVIFVLFSLLSGLCQNNGMDGGRNTRSDKHHLRTGNVNDTAGVKYASLSTRKGSFVELDTVSSVDNDMPLPGLGIITNLGVVARDKLRGSKIDVHKTVVQIRGVGSCCRLTARLPFLRRASDAYLELVDVEGPSATSNLGICLLALWVRCFMDFVGEVDSCLDVVFCLAEIADHNIDVFLTEARFILVDLDVAGARLPTLRAVLLRIRSTGFIGESRSVARVSLSILSAMCCVVIVLPPTLLRFRFGVEIEATSSASDFSVSSTCLRALLLRCEGGMLGARQGALIDGSSQARGGRRARLG